MPTRRTKNLYESAQEITERLNVKNEILKYLDNYGIERDEETMKNYIDTIYKMVLKNLMNNNNN